MRAVAVVIASAAGALGLAALAGAGSGSSPFVNETGNSVYQQTAATNGPVQTSSRQFKRIPGAAAPRPAPKPEGILWYESVTVKVTVVLRSGKGKLRVVDGPDDLNLGQEEPDGTRMYPGSVPLSGKGPHTMLFVLDEDRDSVFPPEIQWKRSGRKPLKAAAVVTSIEGNVD